jgi:hypothetical protein
VTQVPSRSSLFRRPAGRWIASILLVTAACGPAPAPIALPGRSNRPPGGPTVPAKDPAGAGPTLWERWSEVATYRLAVPRAPSQHLAGDHEGEVLTNVAAAAYPDLGPNRALPADSILVQRLFAPGAAAPEVVFAMVKRAEQAPPSSSMAPSSSMTAPAEPAPGIDAGAGWEFLVLDATGMVESRGPLGQCARCHAEAPHDGAFGRAD